MTHWHWIDIVGSKTILMPDWQIGDISRIIPNPGQDDWRSVQVQTDDLLIMVSQVRDDYVQIFVSCDGSSTPPWVDRPCR